MFHLDIKNLLKLGENNSIGLVFINSKVIIF